ncbi:hypothetical protein MPC4_220049 [Methylocella tundrae]|uniref:Uncharacterized protein n=1 Tax=Methylocella tundrae TaxID=227605 RepID=A0A8B6M7D3_METTU|nr:hypothetical protein MPC4_220049 [Methylocella tundrae]
MDCLVLGIILGGSRLLSIERIAAWTLGCAAAGAPAQVAPYLLQRESRRLGRPGKADTPIFAEETAKPRLKPFKK